MVGKSQVSADNIANIIITANDAREFLILTHKDGRWAHRMKRFLPIKRYMHSVKKRLAKYAKKENLTV
jgi:hypothetical protein